MSGVGRPAGQKDKAPRKSRGGADRARALARAASSAGPGAKAGFLSRGGSAGSSGDAPAAAPAVAAPPDAEMEETTEVEEPAPGSGGLPPGPPGAPRPPDLQPDPVVPEVRQKAGGRPKRPTRRATMRVRRMAPSSAQIRNGRMRRMRLLTTDDDNELDFQAAAGDRAAGSTEPFYRVNRNVS